VSTAHSSSSDAIPAQSVSAEASRSHAPWRGHMRKIGLVAALLVGLVVFLAEMNRHVPIQTWLFWRYARILVICTGWALCTLGAGHRLLTLVWRSTLPVLEHVTLSFGAGLLGLFGPTFAIALPVVLLAWSAPSLARYTGRLLRHLRSARARARRPSLWALPIATFGFVGVGMLYFLILSPDNVGYDGRWYHLPLAEHYAAQGAIRATPEGWFLAALPQLATILYCWTLQLPGLRFFDHVELAAHLEFTAFVFTLVGIPALVRTVVPGARAHLAWTALFLFPGILLYDSSLIVGADHIAAVWAVPIYLTARRAFRDLEPRRVALFVAMMAGAALTKYQCLSLIVGPTLAFVARLLWLVHRARQGRFGPKARLWISPLIALAVGALVTAPHWLKNWVFYGDPLYPFLHQYFPAHPWTADTTQRFEGTFGWRDPFALRGTLAHKLKEALFDGVLGFSFNVHDYPFHGDIPTFGSLFTLLLFALPFLRKSLKPALLFACGHVAVFTWYWTVHEDRYLQPAVPWMAAAVAATLTLIWRSGLLARFACAPLVAAQIIWGSDVYFFPAHSMTGQSQIKAPIDLLSARYRKDARAFAPYGVWSDLREAMPKNAKVLVHQQHDHFGLGTMSVNDSEFLEGGISYGRLENPRAVYDLLKGYGVTHLLWFASWQSEDSLAGDLVFWQFAQMFARSPTPFADGVTMALMPTTRPGPSFSDRVFVRTCGGAGVYRDGTYRLADLTLVDWNDAMRAPKPETGSDGRALDRALARAEFVVMRPSCDGALASRLPASFQSIGTKGDLQYWSHLER
jgi:hypothetical protein